MKKTMKCALCILSFLLILSIFTACKQETPPEVTPETWEAILTEEGYVVPDGRVFQHRLELQTTVASTMQPVVVVVYTNDENLTMKQVKTVLFSSDFETSSALSSFWVESTTVLE